MNRGPGDGDLPYPYLTPLMKALMGATAEGAHEYLGREQLESPLSLRTTRSLDAHLEAEGILPIERILGRSPEGSRKILSTLRAGRMSLGHLSPGSLAHLELWATTVLGAGASILEFPPHDTESRILLEAGRPTRLHNSGSSIALLELDLVAHGAAGRCLLTNTSNGSKVIINARLSEGDRLLIGNGRVKLNSGYLEDTKVHMPDGRGIELTTGMSSLHLDDGSQPIEGFRLDSNELAGEPLTLEGVARWTERARATIQLRVPATDMGARAHGPGGKDSMEELRNALREQMERMVIAGVKVEVLMT